MSEAVSWRVKRLVDPMPLLTHDVLTMSFRPSGQNNCSLVLTSSRSTAFALIINQLLCCQREPELPSTEVECVICVRVEHDFARAQPDELRRNNARSNCR
jgi:hypothetical protein